MCLKLTSLCFMLSLPMSVMAIKHSNVSVTGFSLHRNFENVVFVQLSSENPSRLECHANENWDFVLDISNDFGKAMYSTLLTMKASGSTGTFTGTGQCNTQLYQYAEELLRIEHY